MKSAGNRYATNSATMAERIDLRISFDSRCTTGNSAGA